MYDAARSVARVQRLNFASFSREEKLPEPAAEPLALQEIPLPPLEVMDLPKLVPEEAVLTARQEGHAQGYKEAGCGWPGRSE